MYKKFLLLILSLFVFLSCNGQKKSEVDLTTKDNDISINFKDKSPDSELTEIVETVSPYEKAIDEYVDSLSLEEKIGQMFLITIGGTVFSDSYYDVNSFVAPGGYLLFAYNFVDAKQSIDFISDVRNWYAKNNFIRPYFSVDQEGGLVNRLRNIASSLPSANSVSKFLNEDLAKKLYETVGKQISALGIDVNLGPVIEVLTDENESFLGTRSFGDYSKVSIYSEIFIEAMKENNVLPVVKHFPGNNADDPHLGLPIIDFSHEKTVDILIKPFKNLKNKDDVGVLVAHSVVPSLFDKKALISENFDATKDFLKNDGVVNSIMNEATLETEPLPSCLSKTVVTEILQNKLGFSGLIFSDDLLMAALQNSGFDSETAITMAIKAGVNVLMISQKEYMPFILFLAEATKTDYDLLEQINESVKKIIDFKVQHNMLNFNDNKIELIPEMSELELIEFQNAKYSEFLEAFKEGDEFYHKYWG